MIFYMILQPNLPELLNGSRSKLRIKKYELSISNNRKLLKSKRAELLMNVMASQLLLLSGFDRSFPNKHN